MSPYIAHLIGDFLIQTEWMAVNKKRDSWVCGVHVLTYLLPFLFCHLAWWQIGLIGLQHFAQDRSAFVLWWMRAWKRVPEQYWGGIPLYVDQTWHLLWIHIILLLG